MKIIHCTRKLLKELDVPLVEPDKIPKPTEGLGNWYANLLRIDRILEINKEINRTPMGALTQNLQHDHTHSIQA
jgi:hypothetical protein